MAAINHHQSMKKPKPSRNPATHSLDMLPSPIRVYKEAYSDGHDDKNISSS
jgi:hypothetical protein